MQRRTLGSQGPEISVIGYGSWEAGGSGWGPNPADDQVIEAIHAGIRAGINWVDTAEIYGRASIGTISSARACVAAMTTPVAVPAW